MEATPAEVPPTRSIVHHQSLERPSKKKAKGTRTPTSMMKSSGSSSDSLSSQSRGSSSSDTTSRVMQSGRKGSDGEYVDINYKKAAANRVSPDGAVSSSRGQMASGSRSSHLGASHDDSYVAYSPGSMMSDSPAQRPLVLEKVASVVHNDIPRPAAHVSRPSAVHPSGKPVKHDYVNVRFPQTPSPTPSPTCPASSPVTVSSVHSKTPPKPPGLSSEHSKTPQSSIHSKAVPQLPTSIPHRRTPPTKPIPVPPNMKKGNSKKESNDTSKASESTLQSIGHDLDSSNITSSSMKKSSSISFSMPAPFSPCLSPVSPKPQVATTLQSSMVPPFDLGVPLVTSPVIPAPFDILSPSCGSNTAPVTIPSDKGMPKSPVIMTTTAIMLPPFDLQNMPPVTMSVVPPPFDNACPTSPRCQLTTTPKALIKSESGSDIVGRPKRQAKLTSRGSTGSLMSMSATTIVDNERPLAASIGTSASCLLTLDARSSKKFQHSRQICMAGGASSEHNLLHLSRGSINAADSQQPELHYATLDLSTPATVDNRDKSQSAKDFYLPPAIDDNDAPLSYAEIDFVKSEELKMAQKEKRLPFEL